MSGIVAAGAVPPRAVGRTMIVFAGLAALLAVAVALSLSSGPTGVDLGAVLGHLAGTRELSQQDRVVVEAVRLPRTALGLLVGAGLGLAGALMQGLFRNPLADPGVAGVTAGSALAAVAAIVLGTGPLAGVAALFGSAFLPAMAFAGALAATLAVYRIATRGGITSTATLILAGIAVGALASAATGALVFAADDRALRDITFWTLGSLGGATPGKVMAVAPFVLPVLAAIPVLARGLDALSLGEAQAYHMGVRVEWLKRVVVLGVAGAAGAAVAMTGAIGFVGVVVPHLMRLLVGPGHARLLPAAAIGGAIILLVADCAARVVVAPAELPIGILTALVGAPVFLVLVMSAGRGRAGG